MTTALSRLHPALVHHVVNTLGWRSLRPMQEQAVEPVFDGHDALLLAPTAGGKTEAACFPLLSAMEEQRWTGLSIVYVCPLKALLNNLLPRLETYSAWLGRSVALWHGDVSQPVRQRIMRDPPDILLTTPESLESMLVSIKVEHEQLFAGLRAVVVDEVHAFAGDDRGWHLLAVLERLSRLAGRPIQRIGLSATVGNPADLLAWLQGSGRDARPASVVAPDLGATTTPPPGEVELDYVGSVGNAATVIAALHAGEKRLVFCDSRALVEEIAAALRERGVTTFLSHASLSLDERRRAELAFAEARDCVIVSTSTLELGIDVGDLDRVIQVNAPTTVASFLQRLGRTGRRTGSTRNCLFLALDQEAVLRAAALLVLWGRGYVEPVVPPPEPRHIVAQQVLALCLQRNTVGSRLWTEEWNGLHPFDRSAEPIVRFLLGGRSWRVTWIDWKRRCCFVEQTDGGGRAKWFSPGVGGAGFALSRAARDVLLGTDPPVRLTERALRVLAELRDDRGGSVHPGGTVISRRGVDLRWWTWAGYRANATLAATISDLADEKQSFDDFSIRLRTDLTREMWRAGTADVAARLCLPEIDERALAGLKFSAALPHHLAVSTLASRLADLDAAARVLTEPTRYAVVKT